MNLQRAIEIAVQAHKGQVDKGGELYIFHPLRVMMQMSNEEFRIVAVLHDVVEDTDVTLFDLAKEGFAKNIIEAIDCLTKRKGEDYFGYIERVKAFSQKNSLPLLVKLADLEDNMDLSRLPTVSEKDKQRRMKYIEATAILLNYKQG